MYGLVVKRLRCDTACVQAEQLTSAAHVQGRIRDERCCACCMSKATHACSMSSAQSSSIFQFSVARAVVAIRHCQLHACASWARTVPGPSRPRVCSLTPRVARARHSPCSLLFRRALQQQQYTRGAQSKRCYTWCCALWPQTIRESQASLETEKAQHQHKTRQRSGWCRQHDRCLPIGVVLAAQHIVVHRRYVSRPQLLLQLELLRLVALEPVAAARSD